MVSLSKFNVHTCCSICCNFCLVFYYGIIFKNTNSPNSKGSRDALGFPMEAVYRTTAGKLLLWIPEHRSIRAVERCYSVAVKKQSDVMQA